MSFTLPAATATSTSAAKSTRFSSMFQCARAARPPQPVISGMPSRLPPTCMNAPCAAASICTSVSAAAHTNKVNSGLIISSFWVGTPRTWYARCRELANYRGRAGRRWISGLRPRDAEHQVVPRERRKVDIGAQHLPRSIGRFKGESEGDAELGSGDRQIGPRDLDLSRSFDRAAEIGLGLPVGALGRLHRLEAPVVGAHVALGLRVCADLQPVRADQ